MSKYTKNTYTIRNIYTACRYRIFPVLYTNSYDFIVYYILGRRFFTAIIYLPIYFKNLNYYVSNDRIIKESGFYFKKKQIIRIDKIQFTTSVSTPFSKLTGLNFIVLYAYGGMMTVMFLSDHDFAEFNYNLKV